MTREFLKNIKSENRLDKIRLIMTNDDVIGGQPTDDEKFTSNTPFLDIACTMKFAIDATTAAQKTADEAKTAASNADKKAAGAQTAANTADGKATTADGKAVAAQKTASEAKTAAGTADGKAVAAQKTADEAKTAAGTADGKAVAAQKTADEAKTDAGTADGKAVAAQKTADEAKTDAVNADKKVKPITEGGTGATTAVNARKNLGLGSSATLNKTDDFGTSANLVATQLLVDKLQKEMNDAIPVGVIVSWDHDTAPKNWLFVRDQKFSATEYPDLAKLYPNLTLNDRRGTVDRALDAGRGFDSGRILGSYQEDAMQRIYGELIGCGLSTVVDNGLFINAGVHTFKYSPVGTGRDLFQVNIDTANVTRTASETRMKNIATNKIIKAK